MSTIAWMITLFLILSVLAIVVNVLVIWRYYWGDRKNPPDKKE